MQYHLRKPITVSSVPHADICFSPSTRVLTVAANHLEGLSIYSRGHPSPRCEDDVVRHLSYCADLCPNSNTLVAGSADYSLKMLSFSVA